MKLRTILVSFFFIVLANHADSRYITSSFRVASEATKLYQNSLPPVVELHNSGSRSLSPASRFEELIGSNDVVVPGGPNPLHNRWELFLNWVCFQFREAEYRVNIFLLFSGAMNMMELSIFLVYICVVNLFFLLILAIIKSSIDHELRVKDSSEEGVYSILCCFLS